jgi:hypothetical protein
MSAKKPVASDEAGVPARAVSAVGSRVEPSVDFCTAVGDR